MIARDDCPSGRGLPAALERIFTMICLSVFVIALSSSAIYEVAAADGQLIETRESPYNSIFVYQKGDYFTMTFGHNKRIFTETIFNSKDELDLPVTYTQFMTSSLAYVSDVKNILEIGFGGGRTVWYLHKYLPTVPITSVELDPDVIELAKKYFRIREDKNFKVVKRDGRSFLMNSSSQYDIILIDAYRGPFVPFHLLTKEFYQLVKSRLKPGGVVAQNVEPSTMLFDASVATLKAVFQTLDFYEAGGNVVIVAYEGPQRLQSNLFSIANKKQGQYRFKYALPDLIAQRRELLRVPEARVLTDDFAPVETLRAIERHNQKLDGLTKLPSQ